MSHTIKDIAAAIGADAMGDVELRVEMVREPASAGCGDLALVIDPKYARIWRLGKQKPRWYGRVLIGGQWASRRQSPRRDRAMRWRAYRRLWTLARAFTRTHKLSKAP